MSVPLIAQALKVAEQRELSIYLAMVLIALAEFTNGDDGKAHPSLPRLAKRARQSARQAHSAVHRLEELGLVKIGRRGRVLEYTLQLGRWGNGSAGGEETLHDVQESTVHDVQAKAASPPPTLHHVQENPCTTCNSNLAPRASYPLNESPTESPSTELRSAPATPIARKPPDVRAELFAEGLAIYRGLSGVPDGSARKALGALLREARDDAARVMAALRNAADVRPPDPFPFLRATLQSAGLSRHEQIRREAGFGSFLTGDVPPEWLQ